VCEEYVRLLAVYKQALKLYSATVDAAAVASGIPLEEFGRIAGYVDQAKAAAMVAGMELEDHCKEYGCSPFRAAAGNAR